jgi:hypothetical protein
VEATVGHDQLERAEGVRTVIALSRLREDLRSVHQRQLIS